MTEASARIALPFLQSGQAQKELYHNEALALIDIAIAPRVEAMALDDPPTAPDAGQCWIVGSAPTGAWAGHGQAIAGWTGGGWRFVALPEGALAWVAADGLWARRSGSGWVLGDMPVRSLSVAGAQVVGARQPPIAEPAGGTTIDAEARVQLGAILAVLRAHGLIAT